MSGPSLDDKLKHVGQPLCDMLQLVGEITKTQAGIFKKLGISCTLSGPSLDDKLKHVGHPVCDMLQLVGEIAKTRAYKKLGISLHAR